MAHTSLVKTLQKIANSECQRKASGGSKLAGGSKRSAAKGPQEVKFHMPPKDVIECLAASSAGDIRSAINALQFACLKGKSTAWMTYIVRVALHLTVCRVDRWNSGA